VEPGCRNTWQPAAHLWHVMTGPAVLDRDGGHGIERTFQQELVERAAARDEAAFTRIVAAYHPDLLRVAFVVGGGDQALAEDAAQQAWQIAWRHLGDLRDASRLRSWLVAVAANEARGLLRKRHTHDRSIEAAAEGRGDEPRAWAVATDPTVLDLGIALEQLSADDRRLLALRYVAGLNSREIARALGGRPGGVRSRLSRLLGRLRKELGDD
jgi:RNA polymerase sigma-70 factor, ECF subfamily